MKKLSIILLSLNVFITSFVFISANSAYATVVPEACYGFDADTGTITSYDIEDPDCAVDPEIPATIGGVAVTTIGYRAFNYYQLTSLTIPNSVTTIGTEAFVGNQFTSVVIPNSVTSIGDFAFFNNALNSVTISNSITTIGAGVFSGNQLTSLTIPGSVTSIGAGAFRGNQLTSLTIPGSVTSIGAGAFRGNQLTSLTIPNSITVIENDAFSFNQLTSVNIPNSVTSIGAEAFSINSLTSVNIPNSVVNINQSAFWGQGLSGGEWSRLYSMLEPEQAQTAMDLIWYARLYTEDPSNPSNIQDAITTETELGFDPTFDTNQNGADDSLGGHIVNPAQVALRYESTAQQTLRSAETFSGEGLTNYFASQNPTDDMSLYYRLSSSQNFNAPEIAGYTTPENVNLLLANATTEYTFVYSSLAANVVAETVDSTSQANSMLADTGVNKLTYIFIAFAVMTLAISAYAKLKQA